MSEGPRLVKPSVAREMTGGMSEYTVRRLISEGKYPKPVVLLRDNAGRPQRIAFVESELIEWNRVQIEADRNRDVSEPEVSAASAAR